MLDGEAVLLGVDGYSDFNASHSGKHDDEVQFCFSWLRGTTTCASCHYTFAKPTLSDYSRADRRAFSSIRSSAARSVLIFSLQPAGWDWRDWCPSAAMSRMMDASG